MLTIPLHFAVGVNDLLFFPFTRPFSMFTCPSAESVNANVKTKQVCDKFEIHLIVPLETNDLRLNGHG